MKDRVLFKYIAVDVDFFLHEREPVFPLVFSSDELLKRYLGHFLRLNTEDDWPESKVFEGFDLPSFVTVEKQFLGQFLSILSTKEDRDFVLREVDKLSILFDLSKHSLQVPYVDWQSKLEEYLNDKIDGLKDGEDLYLPAGSLQHQVYVRLIAVGESYTIEIYNGGLFSEQHRKQHSSHVEDAALAQKWSKYAFVVEGIPIQKVKESLLQVLVNIESLDMKIIKGSLYQRLGPKMSIKELRLKGYKPYSTQTGDHCVVHNMDAMRFRAWPTQLYEKFCQFIWNRLCGHFDPDDYEDLDYKRDVSFDIGENFLRFLFHPKCVFSDASVKKKLFSAIFKQVEITNSVNTVLEVALGFGRFDDIERYLGWSIFDQYEPGLLEEIFNEGVDALNYKWVKFFVKILCLPLLQEEDQWLSSHFPEEKMDVLRFE